MEGQGISKRDPTAREVVRREESSAGRGGREGGRHHQNIIRLADPQQESKMREGAAPLPARGAAQRPVFPDRWGWWVPGRCGIVYIKEYEPR